MIQKPFRADFIGLPSKVDSPALPGAHDWNPTALKGRQCVGGPSGRRPLTDHDGPRLGTGIVPRVDIWGHPQTIPGYWTNDPICRSTNFRPSGTVTSHPIKKTPGYRASRLINVNQLHCAASPCIIDVTANLEALDHYQFMLSSITNGTPIISLTIASVRTRSNPDPYTCDEPARGFSL